MNSNQENSSYRRPDLRNPYLMTGAALSGAAAVLHVGCIVFGAAWYRFFGAGEGMAQLAAAGDWRPTLITSGIVLVLATWSLYALSGAGVVRRLPLARTALCLITAIYLLRGAAGLAVAAGQGSAFWWWSSAICFTIGVVHFIGTRRAWGRWSSGAVRQTVDART